MVAGIFTCTSLDVNDIGVNAGVIEVFGCLYMQWEMLHIDMFVKGYCPMIWGFV